jgi:peptidoglycan/xylan/chitin deacetylase (PgdA/CDA1 family)
MMGLGVRTAVLSRLAGVRRRVPTGVALTFDDGPMPGTTDAVLDALADLGVRATFFCVGRNAERHPALVHRILSEGHAVGSHSHTHAPAGAQSPRQLAEDYVGGRRAVEDAAGRRVALFRPPYGLLKPATIRMMRACETWTWSVDPADWRGDADAASITAALRDVDGGDVVLLHDWLEPQVPHSGDRSATITSVRSLVGRLVVAGVPLVPLEGATSADDRPV